MIVTRLQLANLRAIELAELPFRAGMNLIVGVNGVGKSTIFGCYPHLYVAGPSFAF